MKWLYVLLGVLLSGPLWYLVARLSLRRLVVHTRRIAAEARQHEYLAELGSLTAGLAHEIKNPLSTIKVNLQLLAEDLDGPTADQRQQRWRRRIQSAGKEVERLQETLDDFLRYAGRLEIHPVRTDVREIVADLVEFFSPQAAGKGVRIRLSTSEQPAEASVDPDMLKQALLNLMLNAQQAMGTGGELIVKAGPTPRGERVVIEIIDTGPGMPPEIAENIFKAYYTTRQGGTGLGLPTARRIIRAHQGQISLDTAPGKGTRFVIELPVAEAAQA